MASKWATKFCEEHDADLSTSEYYISPDDLDAAAEEVVRGALNDHFDMGVTDKMVKQTLKRVLDKLGSHGS